MHQPLPVRTPPFMTSTTIPSPTSMKPWSTTCSRPPPTRPWPRRVRSDRLRRRVRRPGPLRPRVRHRRPRHPLLRRARRAGRMARCSMSPPAPDASPSPWPRPATRSPRSTSSAAMVEFAAAKDDRRDRHVGRAGRPRAEGPWQVRPRRHRRQRAAAVPHQRGPHRRAEGDLPSAHPGWHVRLRGPLPARRRARSPRRDRRRSGTRTPTRPAAR